MMPYYFHSSLYTLGKLFAFRISIQFLIILACPSAIIVSTNVEKEKTL